MRSFFVTAAALAALFSAQAGTVDQTLAGPKLLVDGLIGDVTITVVPSATGIHVAGSGDDRFTSRLHIENRDGRAEISLDGDNWNTDDSWQKLVLTVTVPPGTDLSIDDHIGNATVGDTDAPVAIEAIAGTITIGKVSTAAIESSGSADVSIAEATGALSIDTSGSGEVKVGRAGATSISISGSGDAELGTISGTLGIDVSGSANVMVAEVNGATAVSVSGSSDVYIAAGRASPFAADISGSGDISFAGTAVNPQVSSTGSGSICIGAAEGAVQSDGDGDITISPTACKRS